MLFVPMLVLLHTANSLPGMTHRPVLFVDFHSPKAGVLKLWTAVHNLDRKGSFSGPRFTSV